MKSSTIVLPIIYLILNKFFRCIFSIECDLLLKNHNNNNGIAGIGVYANRNYQVNEVIERSIAVMIPRYKNTPLLDEYAFLHHKDYVDIVFGYGMIYNHNKNSTIHAHANENYSIRTNPLSKFTIHYIFTSYYNINKGDEIFSSYGTAKWFHERGLEYIEDQHQDDASIQYHSLPGCIVSKTEIFHGRVYATQYIEPGEVIEISRALLLPHDIGDENDLEYYLWYSKTNQQQSLLVLGNGGLYQTSTNNDDINLEYSFYEEYDRNSLNQTCQEKVLIQFTATKLIIPNMELVIPLINNIDLNNNIISNKRYLKADLLPFNCF